MDKKGSVLVIVDMQNEFCIDESENIKECYLPIVDNINSLVSIFRHNNQKVLWLNWGVDPELSGISKYQKEKFNNFEYPESLKWKKQKNSFKKVLEVGSWSASIIKELSANNSEIPSLAC